MCIDQTARVHAAHRQGEYRIRFDWGAAGAAAVAGDADVVVVVVVDVLSFTTTLSVALDVGTMRKRQPASRSRCDDGDLAEPDSSR